MNITTKREKVLNAKADVVVFGVFSGVQTFSGTLKIADKELGGIITSICAEEDFGGKLGDKVVIHTHGKITATRLMVVGLGEKKKYNAEALRRAAAGVVLQAEKFDAMEIAFELPADENVGEFAQALTEGVLLADYKYLSFKPQEAKRLLKRGVVTFCICEEDAMRFKAIEKGIALGEVMSRGTIYARDLVNEPAGHMSPRHLLEHAERITKNNKNIKLKVLDKNACGKLGMNAFLAVASGSDEAPYFIHLIYTPDNKKKNYKKIAVIGKGITFDSGGLSLKPAEAMETMKCDMAGAAAVLGIFAVIDDIAPEHEVHGLIAACENMPSGKAMRPGDIVTAMNGKSVEILNTDAEGRLALADTLSYAVKKIEPDIMVDLATLTGACMAGLGPDIAGLMSNDEKLAERLLKASNQTGEAMWRLPLPDDYNSFVAGDHADLRNISRVRYGGAITAGLFLQNFVGENVWAHLDIAGPAFADREVTGYMKKGATGFGTRTILNWLINF